MKIIFKVCLACLLSAITLALGREAFGADKVYCLKQTSAISGDHVAYLCRRGVQITNTGTKVVFVSSAPDWKLCLYNKRLGQYITLDPEKFKGCFGTPLMALRGDDYSKLTWQHLNAKPFQGIAADCLSTTTKKPDEKTVQGLQDYTGIVKANYTIFHDDIVPAKIADAISRFYAIPPVHKVPLQFDYARKREFKSGLQSDSLKTVPYKAELFACPKGLKLAKSESVLLTDFPDLSGP
jgi:hypothetical protein